MVTLISCCTFNQVLRMLFAQLITLRIVITTASLLLPFTLAFSLMTYRL